MKLALHGALLAPGVEAVSAFNLDHAVGDDDAVDGGGAVDGMPHAAGEDGGGGRKNGEQTERGTHHAAGYP